MPDETEFRLHPDIDCARNAATNLFEHTAKQLRRCLPADAQIHHIGATAIPGCLTKGDLDIAIRIPEHNFAETDRILAGRYPRNTGSTQTRSFSAFEDNTTQPHLGLQLTTVDGPNDFFHTFVEILTRNPQLIEHYNTLKRAHTGRPMQIYRVAKDAFITDILERYTATGDIRSPKEITGDS